MKQNILFSIFSISIFFTPILFAETKEARIGIVMPMTGPIATYGQESVKGAELALKQLQQKKSSYKLKFILEDNKGEPIESANAVKKLITIDKVHLVFGSVASSNTLAGTPIAQSAKIPLLTPASTNEKVTKAGDFISRICFEDSFQGLVMAKFAAQTLNVKKIAMIVDNSSDYSKGLAKVFRKEFTQLGGTIIKGDFSYVQKDTDFRSLIRKVKRRKPQAIFLPGYYTEVGLILRQARQLGLRVPFLGGDGWDSPKLQELAGPEGIQNNYLSSHFAPDDKDPRVQSFVKTYNKTYNAKPGAMAALAYDGIMVIADALERSQSSEPKQLQNAIVNTRNFQGVTGNITINKFRNAHKSAVVLKTTAKGNVFAQRINP